MRMIIDEQGRKYWSNQGLDIHTQFGVIRKEDIAKAKPGTKIKSHRGTEFIVIEPSFVDFFENLKRGPAIILLKDAGMISAYTGIGSGTRVVEAGSGTGALTSYLANIVRSEGKVYSYERRKEFLEIAKGNVMNFGLLDYVEFKNKDINDGIKEKDVDVVILDLPEPWSVVKHAEKALKFGGFFVSYIPTVNQVLHLTKDMEKSKLRLMKVISIEEKEWKVGDAMRPLSMQLSHTAFMVFARKI